MTRFGATMWLAVLGSALLMRAQDYQRGPAQSPHGRLNAPCADCHTSTSWRPLRAVPEFNHNSQTRFALRGAHSTVACRLCHSSLVFQNTGSGCSDCHADIHRRQFGAACESCHTVQGWRVAVQSIRSHQNRFPLLGAHATAACESCHKGAATAGFTGRSTECSSCHLTDYERARPLDHRAANLPLNCNVCHGMDNWTRARFDHAQFTRFPLEAAHANLECLTCHKGGVFHGTSQDCFSCHSTDFTTARSVDHVKAGFPRTCVTCHNMSAWSGARFDHTAMTRFPLTGAHQQANCASCHANGVYAGTRQDCYGCHAGNYAASRNPDHTRGAFPTNCAECHTTAGWQGARFDHSQARFQLTGAHVQVACAQCHVGGQFTGTNSQCSGCHMTDFNRSVNPNHVAAGFPQDCTTCHTTVRWTGASFDHNARTRFTLTGAHVQLACAQCHVGGRFASTPTNCIGCHLATFQGATNPNHVAAGFPQDCTTCHTTVRWTGASFDHNASTRFTLTGAHVQLACTQCHVGDRFAGTPTNCIGCHLATFQGTTNPNHVAAGFPQDCTTCHTSAAWRPASFNHANTRFPLTGAHAQVVCDQCHIGGRFAGTPTECAGCHLATFQRTTSPNHVAAGFPQTCASCHTTARWTGATFDHNARTRFTLTGAHVQVACGQCHAGGRYAGTPTDCVGCHLSSFQQTTNPNHVSAGFPQTCTTCHTTAAWRPSSFNHANTRFALTGTHIQVACAQCHIGGKYAGTSTQCAGCHLATYQRTTNPNHVAAGFPQDCSLCHSTVRWAGAAFNHSNTRFPLVGRHTSVTCGACHSAGVYAGLGTACVSCHLANYQRTTNPNHGVSGFPQQCELCHTPAGWTPASFNHSTTGFPLTGRHTTVACANCHVGGRYAGTPTDCFSCHGDLYKTVTDPNHVAAGFPTTCQTCHTTSGWSGATFNHTRFRITSGPHSGRTCSECHTNPNNYQVFTCVTCHTQARTDAQHQGRTGYVYNSANCYSCHPTGRGD